MTFKTDRILILVALLFFANTPRADDCLEKVDNVIQTDVELWAAWALGGQNPPVSVTGLPTPKIVIDDIMMPAGKLGQTKKDPATGEVTIIVFGRAIAKSFKDVLKNQTTTDCPDSNGIDSNVGVGLMIGTLIHELFHLCQDGAGLPIGTPSVHGRYSCTHIAINIAVHKGLCSLIDWLEYLADEESDPDEKQKYEDIAKGACAKIKSLEKYLGSASAIAAAAACVTDCDPSEPNGGNFFPGNPPCGYAWLPCGTTGYPDDVVPHCNDCPQ